jgi:hypothetical protein
MDELTCPFKIYPWGGGGGGPPGCLGCGGSFTFGNFTFGSLTFGCAGWGGGGPGAPVGCGGCGGTCAGSERQKASNKERGNSIL